MVCALCEKTVLDNAWASLLRFGARTSLGKVLHGLIRLLCEALGLERLCAVGLNLYSPLDHHTEGIHDF